MMARDPAWTEQLGNAVLTQYPDVMDAVQRMRQLARRYGYLTPNGYINVIATGGYIQILPVNPDVLYVPYYDPLVVFAPPRPGFAVGGAIHFGPAVTIGAIFGGWDGGLARDSHGLHTRFLSIAVHGVECGSADQNTFTPMCIHGCDR
jgi:hypothetical protein